MSDKEITIRRCGWSDIAHDVAAWVRARGIHVESYWEEHVLSASHYQFVQEGKPVGFFAIHGGDTLWLFAVAPQVAAYAQAMFARARQYEEVTGAMVPTGDEFFLSHAMDNFARLEKQAYFSVYTHAPAPLCEPRVGLRRADAAREEDVAALALAGDFLKEELPKLQEGLAHLFVYIAELDGEIVGFGVVERGRVLPEISSIGMFVLETHRRKGIGSAILRRLRDAEREAGLEPRSGCWYYNHNSKKAQENAGAYMHSRLLHFYF